MAFKMKRNDTRPIYKAQLTQADENDPLTQIPVNLTGIVGVKFIMSKDGVVKVSQPATVTDAANGRVQYTWVTGDTNASGTYSVEWEVTWAGSDKQTFPSEGYLTITIQDDLG